MGLFSRLSLTSSAPGEEDVEAALQTIGSLISWYASRRSTYLANTIAVKLEQLLQREDLLDNPEHQCNLQRLQKKWHYLAQRQAGAPANRLAPRSAPPIAKA